MSDHELAWLDLATAADLIARREISATELLEAVLSRIERLNPALNAYLTVLTAAARADAAAADAELERGTRRGPLHGIPVAVKDIIHVAGVRTTGGSRTLGDYVAPADATCVARLRAAGAILVGKLHTHELAAGGTSENELFGRACNPWNPAHTPGGSSGGSTIATAVGLAHGTLGTDTGGSVRMPSAFCGVVGLKPTFGRVSRAGVLARCWTMDHVGPIVRRVRDAAAMLGVIAGYDPQDAYSSRKPVPNYTAALTGTIRGLRAGVLSGAYFEEPLDPQIGAAFEVAVRTLADLGMEVKRVSFELAAAAQAAGNVITLAEAASTQDEVLRQQPHNFGSDVLPALYVGEFISARQYLRALRIRPLVQQDLGRIFQDVDILLCPTTCVLPPRSEVGSDTSTRAFVLFPHNTRPFSVAGVPALSVPAGFSGEGLPIGLQIIGRPFDETTVLNVGYAYESATEWHTRRPPGFE